MGKSFTAELKMLGVVYDWAQTAPIENLTNAIIEVKERSLLTVGSGGSLTAAHFMTKLHEEFTGQISKHVTPMELVSSHVSRSCGIVLITAGGDNPDILDACRRMVDREPRSLLVLCAAQETPILQLAERFRWIEVIDYTLPSGKDGFLATNSLLAFSVLLTRAYSRAFEAGLQLPSELPSKWNSANLSHVLGESEKGEILRVLKRPTFSVLYEGWGHSAALDMESKFTEAALANVQIADYRNFAHGRHHWLAKRATDTGIIAIVTPACDELADRTLELIPHDIPLARISTRYSGPIGTIDLLASVIGITRIAGEAINIDPGRPGVPLFGRKIYHIGLRSYRPGRAMSTAHSSQHKVWRERKFDTVQPLSRYELLGNSFQHALTSYLHKISRALFAALVCDYDGTLCTSAERFGVPSEDVVAECARLLRSGIVLGIATGRGKSVREALRDRLPQELWSRVIVGYYNGGDIARLDEEAPNCNRPIDAEIQVFYRLASGDALLSLISKFEVRPAQITIEPLPPFSLGLVHTVVLELVRSFGGKQPRVFCSGHSVDVLAPWVSKRNVIESIRTQLETDGSSGHILCIGDKGTWCGNDFDLLSEEYALSVDECPFKSTTGWNLAPRGHRGVQATLDYLRALVFEGNKARLDLRKLRSKHERRIS